MSATKDISKLTPPWQCPELSDLAHACWTGACNVTAIIHALDFAMDPIPREQRKDHPAMKMVVMQLAYLMGESLGPSEDTIANWKAWVDQPRIETPALAVK